MVNAKPKVKKAVADVDIKRAVERDMHAQARIVKIAAHVAVFILDGLKERDHARHFYTPHRQGVGADRVGEDRGGRIVFKIERGEQKQHRRDRDQGDHDRDMREEKRFRDFLKLHDPLSLFLP